MFHLSVWLSFLLISFISSSPINNEFHHSDDYPRFVDFIQNIFGESDPYARMLVINQLREYLNRLCVNGYFGLSHAHACQHIVDLMHQPNSSAMTDESSADGSSTEQHGIQKRFFCNGFIGCKNAGG